MNDKQELENHKCRQRLPVSHWLPGGLFLLLLLILASTACSGEEESGEERGMEMDHSEHSAHHEHASMETDEPTDYSIYHAGSRWLNQNGEELELRDLQGNVQVVTMVYTYCDYACPRIIADMKRIENSLSDEELENTNFVIVSIDPERDTPDRLNTFAEENHLDPSNWTLLNGSSGDIMELAALLGVRYQRISEEDFSHSNIITVLDQQGEVAYRQERIGDQPRQAIRSIKDLVAEN